MRYSLPCPAPGCRDVYEVDAADDDEAAQRFLREKMPPRSQMPPMSDEQLLALIGRGMRRIDATER